MPVAAAVAPAGGAATTAAVAQTTTDSGESETNFTRLYVDARESYLDLKPGESGTFTVTVENGEDEAVDVNPHLFTSPAERNPLEESWVDISGPDSIDAGEEAEYEVSVSVPEDASIARYSGQIAFTNQTTTPRAGMPPRPIHAAYTSVNVWEEPTVKILSETYISTQVEAGDSVTKQIVIKNTGEESVPLSPERAKQRGSCYGSGCPEQVDQSWIDIDAPSQIAPGETATVTVTISPDEDATRGRYDTSIDLGLQDPNRPEQRSHWQEISLNFVVWEQPEEPFEADFTVDERTDNVTLTLTPRNYRAENADGASFDVTFVSPDGERIDAKRVQVSESGYVNLGAQQRPGAETDGAYATDHATTQFVYVLDAHATGEWSLDVMPENTIRFQYEPTRNEPDAAE